MNRCRDRLTIFVQAAVVQELKHTQFVAAGGMELQGLGQIGNLALFLELPGSFPNIRHW